MNRTSMWTIGITVWLAVLGGYAVSAHDTHDKHDVTVPGGLSMLEFKGYEGWQAISFSRSERVAAVILGNPAMIEAYKAGFPANGQAIPDGAKMAKIHWIQKPSEFSPGATVPDKLLNVDFMEKDSKRFADSGGWGYAVFDYDGATDSFKPGTTAGTPPQGNDAKCGFACHSRAKARDYVFTDYGNR
ncbi:MAG TPA: cytochrome P460 family protein [Vicinamibacterales bacterium]|nr:cytochrome P460 family protein [Vicinamibacterales bacterium]